MLGGMKSAKNLVATVPRLPQWPPATLFYQPLHAHCLCLAMLLQESTANAANQATVEAW